MLTKSTHIIKFATTILVIFSLTTLAQGAEYKSVKSGNWTDASVWDRGTVPTNRTDDVITIIGSHTITLSGRTVTANNINIFGTLIINSDASVTTKGTLSVYKSLINHGTINECRMNFGGSNTTTIETNKDLTASYLTINNTSAIDDTSNGVHVTGGNITVTTKLNLTKGVLYLDDTKHIYISKEATKSSDVCTADPSTSFVDGSVIMNIKEGNTFMFPVGNNGVAGYAWVKSKSISLFSTNRTQWRVRFHKVKSSNHSSSTQKQEMVYDLLCDQYWEVEWAGGYETKVELIQLSTNSDNDDFKLGNKNGAYSGMYYCPKNGTSWTEITGASVNPSDSNGDRVYVTSNDISGKITIGKNSGAYYFAYGIRGTVIDKIINAINNNTNNDNASISYPDGIAWIGKANNHNWSTANNWLGGVAPSSISDVCLKQSFNYDINVRVPISGQPDYVCTRTLTYNVPDDNYPTLSSGQSITVNSLTIDGTNPVLTINGGCLIVNNAVTVNDPTPGHIVINNTWDNNSAFKYGSINDYDGVVVNRTLRPSTVSYTGSATQEGTFTAADATDVAQIAWYNATSDTYEKKYYYDSAQRKYVDAGLPNGHFAFPTDFKAATVSCYNLGLSIQQTGTLYQGNGNVGLSFSGDETWNYIVNPYMYGIDLTQITNSDLSNADATIWFRRKSDSNNTYHFYTYNIAAGVGTTAGSAWSLGKDQDLNKYTLAPQQAFMVLANGSGAKINLRNASSLAGTKLKSASIENDVVRLKVSAQTGLSDETALVFREGGSSFATSHDSQKYGDSDKANCQLYILKDGKRMSIPFYPEASEMEDVQIPVGVRLSNGSTEGTISFSNADEFNPMVNVYLTDVMEGTTVDMRNEDYHFSAQPGATLNNRFVLTLKSVDSSEEIATGIVSQQIAEKIIATRIIDLTGRLVLATDGTLSNADTSTLKGIYIVETITDKGRTTQKQLF